MWSLPFLDFLDAFPMKKWGKFPRRLRRQAALLRGDHRGQRLLEREQLPAPRQARQLRHLRMAQLRLAFDHGATVTTVTRSGVPLKKGGEYVGNIWRMDEFIQVL